jgi:hypothetical protein
MGVAGEDELVATGAGEPVSAGGNATPGELTPALAGFEIGPPVVRPPIVSVPEPQQDPGEGVALGVGVLVPAGGDAGSVEPAMEPCAEPPAGAPAGALLPGTGWFGGTLTGPGPNGIIGSGPQVAEAVGVGVGVGVVVAATWAMTNPDGIVPAGSTTGLARVEPARSAAITSVALVEVVPSM